MKILAAVMCSNLFFLASCTGGVAIGAKLNENLLRNTSGRQSVDSRMMVVALVPEPKEAGKLTIHHAMLANLDKFKTQHAGYSFLLPVGSGSVTSDSADMYTRYTVQSAGEGKVLVETMFNHEMLDVFGRYEATATEIRPLNSKAGSNYLFGMISGFVLACVLRISGEILRRFVPPKEV